MKKPCRYMTLATAILVSAVEWTAYSPIQEPAKCAAKASTSTTKVAAKKSTKNAVQVEGGVTFVGQRTVTFQVERKGKFRDEAVGVDDETHI
jgi:hypothetical protein